MSTYPVIAEIEPQAIIILVVMIIGAIRWFLENVRKKSEPEEDETSPFEDLYEEARREIQQRQAREYPTEEEMERTLYEGSREAQVVTAPPSPAIPPPLPPQLQPSITTAPGIDYNSPPSRPTAELSAAEQQALDRWNAGGTPSSRRRRSRGRSKVRDLLATPSSARDAIVLREILGPPKGMEAQGGKAQG